MNEDAIKDAYDLFVNTGYNKSYENFKTLIQSNPNARKDAYDLFVSTGYNKTQKDFDELMGIGSPAPVKKKEQVSPSQQKAQPTSSVTGAMVPDGAPVPSAKKGPSLQEQLQSGINLAASAAVASSKPGYTPVPKEEADKALYGKANVQTGTLKGIPGQTKSTVQNLNEKYKDLGVSFKEAPSKIQKGLGLGDIVVTADDGSTHIVQSTGSDEKLREEEAKLQTFLMGKSAGVEKKPVSPMEFLMMSRDGISPQEEAKFKRVYSQELVDSSIKFANNELEKTKNGVDKIQAEIAKLNEDAMIGGVTPEIEARFSELQGEYERSIKYAKSIASLTDEGVKKAAGENARIMGEQGNLPSAMYNSLLKFVENSVTGVLDIANQAASVAYTGLAELASINMGVDVTAEDLGDAKAAREAYTKAIDNVMSSVEADVSEEYVQSLPPVLKALVGAAEFVPNMLIPAANIRYGVLVSQGVGRRLTELNDSPMTKDLPENEKFFMSAVPAMVEAALENFGISQWAGANKGLISSVTVDVLSKIVPQAGMRGVKKLINAEINNLVLRGAVNTAGAMISEAETGALQSISDTAFREAYEIAKGKDLFNQPGFNEEGFKEALLEDAKMEALGGMWMAGAANIAQQTAEYVTGKSNTNETFALMKQILASNTTESALASTLKSQILSGKISKEQAQNTFRNFREAKAIVRELPQELSEDNQRAAFDLIAEKRKLTKQIEGKDPSLVDKQKTRITAIDQELKNISNAVQEQATSEVPVQPGAAVSGEVAQGEPQAEPEVVTEEIIPQEEIATRQAEAESKIKGKDLFSDGGTFSNVLGGSGVDSVPTAHSETNGIEFVQFSNPTTGQVDVIMTGTSDSDFVGFYRIYENGKPTNKWSSKFENQSRNKENFKTMISGVQSMLPNDHEYTEKTSISTDGLRVWNQQLDRGYELQFDDNGNVVTNEVAINGDAIVNELGIDVLPGEFENITVTTNDQFNKVRKAILPYLKSMGLSESNIKWEDGTVKIDLPVLKKAGVAQDTNEVVIDKPTIAANSKTEVDAVKNAAEDVETGQTFNLDGTVYTDGGLVVPVISQNMTQEELTPELIADFVEENRDKIGNNSVKVGIYKFPNSNEVSIDLNIVVPRENREAALEFGRLSGQESLFDLDTFENIKTGSDGKNISKFNSNQFVDIAKALKSGNVPNVFGDTNFDQAVNNSAQSLKMVAPDLKVIVAENTEDAQLQIAEALSAVAPSQAADVAEGFTTETRGQTVFVNGKPFAIVLDKSQADSKTVGHEAWELMLNDAFGDDQAKFKEFRDEIDRQLRLNGYGEIADALTKFSNQRGYEDVKYSEYMAELGGMLVANGFKQGSLDAKQKSLLQKIGDVINKFAQLFTGKKQFLDEATPDDILGFMITISNKVAKGEDVSQFFREKNTQEIKDTKKVFSNRSQKIGDFDIQYFEDEAAFQDLVDRKLVVQNASIDEAAGQPVATHQPDNLLVGNVNYKGKKIMEGNGGIYYVLKFGNVWASGKQNSAKTLANYINKSRKESTDGIGRMVLVRGSQDKMISSVQGVKAAMRILEELVFDNLISTSDFRKALTSAGKAYNIDFSGANSAKQIQKDIEDKFMNVSDSTFAKRGDFFSTLVNEIGKLESAKKNIKEIQKALGATKNIQFSKGGIREQIGTVLTERLLIGLESGNAYAIVEVDEDVVVKKDDQHPSYPFSIVTKSGKPPVLKVFNYRPKAVEAITTMSGEKASNAKLGLAQMGMGMGRIASDKEIVVKSRSQKNVPAVVDEVLTDDGKGNYVFVHYSDERRDTIKPMSGSNKNFTSREEVAAISSVGGVAMYYTKQGQKEQGVGNVPHTVLVPKDKVYFYGTTERGKVSNDPENFYPEARRRFQEYKNRGNEARPTEYAFDSNNAAAWIGKVASENGYDMLVTNWGAPTSYRAQTVKELTPEADYTGFKEIPEPTYEVGDEVFLYGKYATLTDVKPDVLTYEVENAFGGVDSGKFPLTVMTRDKIIMVQKAKPTVTTKSQKVVVNTIPGYERMMGEVEGMLDKTMNRTGSYNQATANAVGYIQKSAVYERADDSQREQIIRDFLKIRGEKFKVAPSVGKILGQIKDVKKVTVNEKTALKDQIKLEAKAAKDAVAFVKQLRVQISGRLKMMAGRGVISAKQASTILARYDRMNILNPDMRDRFVDYMANVFQSAEYADKVKEATKLRKTIRKAAKNPDNQAENSKMAKSFAEIDPSRVENIDDYLNNAEQMLKAVSRKTGDVKMRSLINMTDMVSYIDGEIQEQRKQIKNEILSKYQDLVDAGVLDSKMTINEINKVVAAIEENEDESAAKAKEAKAAVKQMMDEVSPILLQVARTGEDPFTGDPIDLAADEKRDLVKLAKMDLDSLSLADALKAVEYANNFISNGIFSGIGAIVSVNEGSLEPAKLKKEGVMSRRLRKYFSPKAGRAWAEQLGSLPMLNKLLFLSNEKAIKVAEASGVTGISVGKAKAIKIVEKAVKEYTDKFSSLKDFRTGENIIERGILAFVSRTVIGDKFQVQDEFNRRKSLIEETIQALTDPNNSTDADIKKGELIEKVYDKILKDAKNVNDVRAKVSDVNKKAVDWWVNEWSKHYDRMDEVSRSVYNTLLTRDANFTPDRFQSIDLTTASENDFESSFFSGYENVSTDKSGSLKENKRIKNLPSDKNGNKTRIVNLDFDMNNANALTNALIDVETASSVLKAKGFATSKDFGKIFSSKDDAKLYKRRLISYVNNVKGKSYVDQSELTNMGKALNVIGSFGTAKALFSLSQPFKQSIPPLFNTLVQTGRNDIGTLFSGGNDFIDKTGYPIVNRGISSLAELQAVNKKIAEAEKNLLAKGIMGIAEYNNKMLEIWLQKPDVFTARSSWLSFYIDSLKKQGITTRGIDWKTHEMNKKAADYAQLMVDSQQNVSDSDMQGMLLTDKTPYAKAVRKALFTLMTFTLNQKTRIWSDMRTLSNKKLTSEADRKEALLSLGGAIVELVSFHSISLSVAYIVLQPLVDAMMEALGYEDEEEDKELEKKKLLMNKMASLTQSFLKDFILPPMPIVGSIASGKVNEIMDEYGVSEKIAAEGFGIEDGESKFKMYDREDYSFIDALGPAGIAAEKGKELFDFSALASTGKFDVETKGGLVTKQIIEENEDLAKINASIMSAYYLGILPGELAYIARKLDKKIKKGAEVVEEEED